MRKTFIIGTAVIGTAISLLATTTVALAATSPPAKPATAALTGGPGAGAPGNSTAYERAITAYLDNVVEKARKKLPRPPAASPSQGAPGAMGRGYPSPTSSGSGSSRAALPRVERITIGLKARARLDTPSGGLLRVSPGVVTPYGQVTTIRAAGVWFRRRGARHAVELADISPEESGSGPGAVNPGQSGQTMQEQPMNVPPPPTFQHTRQ